MRIVALFLAGLACLISNNVSPTDQPRGSLLELHSCELYAGGCVVSSEATLGGRYMLRAWNFTGGTASGTALAGLQLALLQASCENLAMPDAEAGRAVIYLPSTATDTQRAALVAWLKSTQTDLHSAQVQTRIVPIHFAKVDTGYTFSAGNLLSLKTASLESCETGACGEALWYTPRTATTMFTVAVDRASRITEPFLKLKWDEAGKRSVFLAKFGEDDPSAKNLFVSSAEFCGPTARIF